MDIYLIVSSVLNTKNSVYMHLYCIVKYMFLYVRLPTFAGFLLFPEDAKQK